MLDGSLDDLEEPMSEKKQNCFLNYIKMIIFILFGVIFISVQLVVVIILILILLNKDKKEKQKIFYDYGYNITELRRRTSKEYFGKISLLKADSKEYKDLEENDKKALYHLIKAGEYLDNIEFQIDDHHNIPFKKFLESEIKKNVEEAKLTKILFDGQKGINGLDTRSNEINLALNHTTRPGIGVYPEDLTKEEFQKILIKMLKEKKIEEVKNITNQRTIVKRDGEYLKAIDYVEYFKEDFNKMADEFEIAANFSTDKNFTEYLKLQAKALRVADPMLDAYADKKWAELQLTPLELTISRESYADEITPSFVENEELTQLLKNYNITPIGKDNLGLRVGIVNKEGTAFILKIKSYLKELAKQMPYHEKYEQKILIDKDIKQTMVDVDLILLSGELGDYRGSITEEDNLPNDDKLSLSIGGGKRNVFYRQLREGVNDSRIKADLVLDHEQRKYFDIKARHWFIIGHENIHSLGPKIKEDKLGKYSSIIEENKADMGSLAFVNSLTKKGFYNEEQRKKIIVTSILEFFLLEKPLLTEAHSVRSVMQNYYLYQKGAYNLTKNETIHINIDKVVSAAYEMLSEIIEVQIQNNFKKAEEYVKKYFVWTDEMKKIGNKLLSKGNLTLNNVLENELADKILSEKY